MSNYIDSIGNYNVSNKGLKKEEVQARLSQSTQAVSDNFESNSAVKTISGTAGGEGIAQSAPLVALLYVIDKFIDGRMAGNPDSNILGKMAKIGDKISDALHLENFMSGEKIANAKSKIASNRFTKYFTDAYKANPISSMAKPSSLAKNMTSKLDDQAQKLVSDFVQLKYNPTVLEELRNLGTMSPETLKLIDDVGPLSKRLTPKFLESVTSVMDELGGVATKTDAKAVSAIKENIGKFLANADDVTELGLSEQLASFFSKFSGGQYAGKAVSLSEGAEKVISSVSTKKFTTKQILDAVDDFAAHGMQIESKNLSIVRNKAAAATSKIGKTTLGKIFSKGFLKTKDVATYGGGLISLFFMASAIRNAVKATKEAPKGEKKATFAHVLSEQYLGIILFQPSINLLYKVGGNKYRGMTVEAREALANLVKNTNADKTITKEGIKIAKMQQKLLLKGVDKDKVSTLAGKGLKEAKNLAKSLNKEGAKLKFWERPLKFMGRVLSMGLDTIKTRKPKQLGKFKLPNPTLKGFVGGAARFAIILMVIQPFLQKPITKLVHKIFGKPKTYLEKQNTKENKPAPNGVQSNAAGGETNLLKQWENKNNAVGVNNSQSQQNSAPNPTTVNNPNQNVNASTNIQNKEANITTPINQNNVQGQQALTKDESIGAFNLGKDKKNPEGRYIPSIEPVIVDDNEAALAQQADAILKSTDGFIADLKKSLN